MKRTLTLKIAFLLFSFFSVFAAKAQNAVTTVPPLNAGNSQSGITFNVRAFSSLTITDIWVSFNNYSLTVDVWYNPDSVNGAPTISAANGWVKVANAVPLNVTSGGAGTLTLIPQTFSINMTAGSCYGFYVETNNSGSGTINYTNWTSGQYLFTDGTLQINTGSACGYGGPSPNPTFNPRMFNGKIGYVTGPPCPGPGGLYATNILSNSATVGWNPVSGSTGYDYVIDQAPGNPTVTGTATTATTANVGGLTPSTNYYLHVRNKCTATNKSPWVHYPFTTLPPCNKPLNFSTTNLMPTSTTINWDPVPTALNYDYIVDQNPADPGSSTGAINVTTNSANITSLNENEWYYVHIRSHCVGGGLSEWSLDSFLTPIPCRAPDVKIDHLNTNQAVAYWEPVPTAMWYEYAITQMSIPPVIGTRYDFTSLHTSALGDGDEYYIHVRCNCKSVGVEAQSPWTSVSFKTWPSSVVNVNADEHRMEVYPNPVKDVLTVSFDNNPGTNAVILVTDVTGKTVRSIAADKKKITVNMSGLAPGMYMIKYSDNAHTEVMRVTKQ